MEKGLLQHKIGDTFDGFVLIKQSTKGTASTGKAFLTLYFVDSTGEIDAKLWDASKEDVSTFSEGTIVRVTGDINEFRGKAQMRIKAIRPAQVTDNVSVEDFLEKAPIQKDVLQEKINEAIFEIENAKIQRIVRSVVQKYQKDLFVYPAASKNHHAFVSGLAYHVVSMLKIAKSLCEIYPSLNKDLLYAGIILHDIGKVHELSGPVATSYTMEGKLLGHISIMVSEVQETAKELKIEGEEVTLLKHMVLSHHGKPEWGSAVQPMLKEAEMLHIIDMIDAKMNMLDKALSKTAPGEFTERLFTFEHRSFFNPEMYE